MGKSLDVGRPQLSRQIRILGKILEVPTAQGASLHVQAKPQQHGHILRLAFLPQGLPQVMEQRSVKGGRKGGGCGIAHGLYAYIDAQVVPSPFCLRRP